MMTLTYSILFHFFGANTVIALIGGIIVFILLTGVEIYVLEGYIAQEIEKVNIPYEYSEWRIVYGGTVYVNAFISVLSMLIASMVMSGTHSVGLVLFIVGIISDLIWVFVFLPMRKEDMERWAKHLRRMKDWEKWFKKFR